MKNILPKHIAIIMDGNRRWAKINKATVLDGHRKGVDTLVEIVELIGDLGIDHLTVYALSSENYKNRSKGEVTGLLNLIKDGAQKYMPRLKKGGIKLHFIGDIGSLPSPTRLLTRGIQKKLSAGRVATLHIALNYGGREEIFRAARKFINRNKTASVAEFENGLYTAGLPDPDLVIRTGGQMRISNFLLWQSSYSEFYFTDILWPDFGKEQLKLAIKEYQKRNRNFGV